MFISCKEWYEKYIGDTCDNDCENCYGNKENVFAKVDFSITCEMLTEVKIKKGERFWIYSESIDRVILKNDAHKDKFYEFRKEFFKDHFSYQNVESEE